MDTNHTLGAMGEDALIQRITHSAPTLSNVHTGVGDDCAVLHPNPSGFTLLKTDTIIENVHFLPSADPFWLGWKSVARVVSDFAAMGGKPDALMVAIAMPKSTATSYVDSLYQGIYHCAEKYQFSIVGGETSTANQTVITISGTGICPHEPISRYQAQLGDTIYVTGTLGGSIEGKHLSLIHI